MSPEGSTHAQPSRSATPRVLLVSAAVGEGHDGPARTLSAGLIDRGADPETIDAFAAAGPLAQRMLGVGSQYDSRLGNVSYDLAHRAIAQSPRGQRAVGALLTRLFARRLLVVVARAAPDVVVATYPGASEVLGRMRLAGRLRVPLLSAVTDLASLRYWAHAGVDEHLLIHPESVAEVRAVAGAAARATTVHGLTDPAFRAPAPVAAARAALGLAPEGRLVVVSGGGWAVGDLGGAVDAALAAGAEQVVVLCGRRDDVRATLQARFAQRSDAVLVWGFTERMPEILAAADVLVHSTAGLTVLEALMCGCHVISFGWGRGHIRANNRAYAAYGLADVAEDRAALAVQLGSALGRPRGAPLQLALPEAADIVLAWAR